MSLGFAVLAFGCTQNTLPDLSATLVDFRINVAEDMRASREMQLSGEPFAEILDYNLNGFSRTNATPDQYDLCYAVDGGSCPVTDLLGYVLAVESYEYSKQPMNNVSFESGAGISLMYGPVLNPGQMTGPDGYTLLDDRFQHFAWESFAENDAGAGILITPGSTTNAINWYGWGGVWPVMAPYTDFDPRINADPVSTDFRTAGENTCVMGTGSFTYGGAPAGDLVVSQYECDYNTLHLPDRSHQVSFAVSPDALGYTVWKQGLWVINYWETMQDTAGNPITYVDPADRPMVGQQNNTVVGQYPNPADPTGETMIAGAPGVYLGDIPMEGWQGMTMVEEMDNQAALLLGQLASSDGVTLTAMPSVAAALNYDYSSPLVYFPERVAVTEQPYDIYPIHQDFYFAQPTSYTIADASSHLAGLSGLLGGYAEAFAITDTANANVGGSVPWLCTFDGDPFPGEDPTQPYGQATLHDRVLGVLKIAAVDLDRLHFDSHFNVLTDTATVSNGQGVPGTTVTTLELNEAVLAMRNAYRGLNSSLQLYSNDTPDVVGAPTALDAMSLAGASYTGTLSDRLRQLIQDEADFLSAMLIGPSGQVSNGFDLSTGAVDPSPTTLESETGALRALLEAYLVSGNEAYRQRAIQVFGDLQTRFWMSDVQLFRTTAGEDDLMQYTPIRLGTLSGALRQYYKLVASDPSQAATATLLLHQLVRTYKVVANGWNDVNQDNVVQYPQECLGAHLEMAERALTGELGHPADDGDREHDCIRELSVPQQAGVSPIELPDGGEVGYGLPAALAAEVDIARQ